MFPSGRLQLARVAHNRVIEPRSLTPENGSPAAAPHIISITQLVHEYRDQYAPVSHDGGRYHTQGTHTTRNLTSGKIQE